MSDITTSINDFDSKEWIRKYAHLAEPLNYESLEPIFSFMLIWNIFESKACGNIANLKTIKESVNATHSIYPLSLCDYDDHLAYFKKQYVEKWIDDLPKYLLSDSYQSKSDKSGLAVLTDVIEGKPKSIDEIVISLLFIAYRVRNNLFHGEKAIYSLSSQIDLFRVLNSLICTYLAAAVPGRERVIHDH